MRAQIKDIVLAISATLAGVLTIGMAVTLARRTCRVHQEKKNNHISTEQCSGKNSVQEYDSSTTTSSDNSSTDSSFNVIHKG